MLGLIVDRAIDTTVISIAIGYSGYGSVARPFQLWAQSTYPAATQVEAG